jgi:NADP-dependent 3-hydroxy acid dehydrogenase YdfG
MTRVLDGTAALVTGASSGIGAATAAALASQGAAVALAARRKDRLEELAAEIRAQGGTALVLESDITREAEATAAVERTVAELGRLDTLINNAGSSGLPSRSASAVRPRRRLEGKRGGRI